MTTRERWQELENLFARALEHAPNDRKRFVEEVSVSDPALRVELASLLAHAEQTEDAVRRAIGAEAVALRATASANRVGRMVGPYVLTSVLGQGGMGTVFIAERHDGAYRKHVAIKLMHAGVMTERMLSRFHDERQVLASLDHPNIVRLLDGGTMEDGTPYLVMEHVDGTPLAEYARTISVRERVRLVIEIASALQYAHQKLVVHRDVKPANVLVDRNGTPKLLDFGIAKLLGDSDDGLRRSMTTGLAPCTLEYASPEQVRGESVTVATDVYGLGAVLYELFTGDPPQRRASLAEMLTNICEREPRVPSSVAPVDRRSELAGDLDSITVKALQREPAQRYASMGQFSDDLQRYLDGLPVLARTAGTVYLLGKFIARHRGKLALATAIVCALAGATVVSILQAQRADRQAAASERDKRALLRERGLQELASGHALRALPYLTEAMREGDDTAAMRFLLAEAMRPLQREIATTPVPEGAVALAIARTAEARFAVGTMSGRVLVYDDRARIVTQDVVGTTPIHALVFSEDGTRLAASSEDGMLSIWDATQVPLKRVLTTAAAADSALDFVEDGHAIAAVTSTGTITFINATTGRVEASAMVPLENGTTLMTASAALHESRMAVATSEGSIFVWNHGAITKLGEHRGTVRAMRFTENSEQLVSTGDDRTAKIWNVAEPSRTPSVLMHRDIPTLVDAAAGRAVTASDNGTAWVWNLVTGRLVASIPAHPGHRVRALHLDGDLLITVGEDATVRLWSASSGRPIMVMESDPGAGSAGHSVPGAHDARILMGGARIVTIEAKYVRLWRVDQAPLSIDLSVGLPASAAVYGPEEQTIAVAGGSHLAIWDLATRTQRTSVTIPNADIVDATWSPNGSQLLLVGVGGMAHIYDANGHFVRALAGHATTQKVHRGTWSPDGHKIVTAGNDGTARVWDATNGALQFALPHPEAVMAAAWRPDGACIVTSCRDRKLRIWNAATGSLVSLIDGRHMQFLDVTYSPDGHSLATASRDGDGAIWDVATGQRRIPLEGHDDVVIMSVWSPDGELIATSADNGAIGIWDPLTGSLLAMRVQPGEPLGLVWSRDSTRIMVASNDGHVRIWDVTRALEPPAAIAKFVAKRVPFRLNGARIERVALP